MTGSVSAIAGLHAAQRNETVNLGFKDSLLLIGLMSVTLITALVVFLSLGRGERAEPAAETSSL